MDAALLEAAIKLPPQDRRELIERLYDSLEPDADESGLSPQQEAELAQCVAELDAHGPRGRPWREVMSEIRAKHLK